jgi:hypothetical protein
MIRLHAYEHVILGYVGLLTLGLLAVRPEGTWIFLAYHAAAAAMVGLVPYAQSRFGGRAWGAVRTWYVLFLILAAFREVHYLAPLLHPFEDARWDRLLADIDRKLFGNLDALFLSFPPLLMDAFHACYASYFGTMIVLAVILMRSSDPDRLREYLSVITLGMLGSYLGYYLVPAIGPHWFYPGRPAILDGWILGGPAHRVMVALEWKTPDAFPSGHALMSMLVMACARKYHPPALPWLAVPASGCILATMVLRYHYAVDVIVSAMLFPAVYFAGIRLHRRIADATSSRPPASEPPPRA